MFVFSSLPHLLVKKEEKKNEEQAFIKQAQRLIKT
jgi:hypothetical protein